MTTVSRNTGVLKAEGETDRLSLSRFRMSSLNVSLFFCSIPLTSYTTWTHQQGAAQSAAAFIYLLIDQPASSSRVFLSLSPLLRNV